MSLANSLLGRSYQLLRPLGREGTETLYLAQKLDQDSQLVAKVVPIDEELAEDSRVTQRLEKLFYDKLQTLSQLHHTRIAPILDFGHDNINHSQYFYVVMDYYAAGSLEDRLATTPTRLTLAEIACTIAQVAEALQYAHEREIIHQAVKPSNLLLTQATFPDLQLTDAGLGYFFATLSSRGLSQGAYVRGTSMFMAPEQWEGQAVPASDQYALAVMAYYLLTGQYPFQGSLSQIIQQHQQARPPVPSRLNRSLNAPIDKIIARALAKQPEKRFPSVLDFSQAFANALQGVSDRPDIFALGETSFVREAIPVLTQALPSTLPAPAEIATLHEESGALNTPAEMPVVEKANDTLSVEEDVLSAPAEKLALHEENVSLAEEQRLSPVSDGNTVVAKTAPALTSLPGNFANASANNGSVVPAQPVLQLKHAPALPPILPPVPISQVTTRSGRFSLLQKSLVAILLAAVVLLGSGALLLRNIIPSARSQASSNGWVVQVSGNSGGGITINVSPTSPGQTSTAGSSVPSANGAASGSGSTSGSSPSSGPGSTPVAGSTPASNTGPGSSQPAPTRAPTPTPTRAPTPTPTPHGCDVHNWTATLSPTYFAGGNALYVSPYCGGAVYLTLTSKPPSGGHEVDLQICYGLRTTNCSSWVRYSGNYVWLKVATGRKSGQIFYINGRCTACTGSAFKVYGSVKY